MGFNSLSIKAKLLVGFTALSILIAFVGYRGISSARQLNGYIDAVGNHSYETTRQIAEIKELENNWHRAVLNIILFDVPAQIKDQAEKTAVRSDSLLAKVAHLGVQVKNAEAEACLKEIEIAWKSLVKEADATHYLSVSDKKAQARDYWIEKGRPLIAKVDANLARIQAIQEESVKATMASSQDLYSGTRLTLLMVVGFAILAALAMGFFLASTIGKALGGVIASLTAGSEQISSASGQVSSSSQSLAEGASDQASSLEETSASLEELSSMTKRNSDNARQANGMAGAACNEAEGSQKAMERMGEAIGKIKQSADQTAKIIKTIDEIAFQTNLLALNAAVEAARAGDAGKGFAVVAEEVRNLARRSAEAAQSTAALIEESQKNADQGVSVSGEVAGILSAIVGKVQKLAQLIGEVSAASDEQAKGIEQIGLAMNQMDKITQANAASAEESASASEELFAQAKELGDMVGTLVGIVTGNASGYASISTGGNRPARRESEIRPVQASRRGSMPVSRSGALSVSASGGRDWTFEGAGVAGRNGHPVAAKAEKIIPLNDEDLKEF